MDEEDAASPDVEHRIRDRIDDEIVNHELMELMPDDELVRIPRIITKRHKL